MILIKLPEQLFFTITDSVQRALSGYLNIENKIDSFGFGGLPRLCLPLFGL